MTHPVIRIATRKSPLAMVQTHAVKDALLAAHDNAVIIETLGLMTEGDAQLATPLAKIGGKGLFIKSLETAMLTHQADIAVHSMKDMPAVLSPEFRVPVICKREDPRDVFVSNTYKAFDDLPDGARVGTSSLRRQCQLLSLRPDLTIVPVRGNVGTRLRKLDEGLVDALILAAAGLKRLSLESRITAYFSDTALLPAIAQGAVGIECRQGDAAMLKFISPLRDAVTTQCIMAERAMNAALEGGCQLPVAGFAIITGAGRLWLRGLVGSVDGKTLLRAQEIGSPNGAESIGKVVAEKLLNQGAGAIIQKSRTE